MRTIYYFAILGLALSVASTAEAIPVSVDYDGLIASRDIRVIHPFGSGRYRIGEMDVKVDLQDGEGFVAMPAFCVDLRQNTSTQAEPYELTGLDAAPQDGGSVYSPMGMEKATAIRELWGEHYDEIDGNSDKAAAFQVAIWEIIYENAPDAAANTWNVTSGNVLMESGTVANIANGFLATVGDDTQTLETNLMALTNYSGADAYQDFVVMVEGGGTPPVPEPMTMATALLGLCSLGTYIRRRTAV